MIEKLDMKTPDFTTENIAQIAALFPNCVTETKDTKGNIKKAIDFDLLKQELSENIVDGVKERYSLNWPGKKEALVTANKPINKTLRPDVDDSVNFDTTQNLYIEGDNLEALKLLQESYLNKIKMIYIDPPYNTGKDFVYKDNFTGDKEEELEKSGQISEEGQLVANLESNGRYHSDWLSMIYPRLKLARNLLKEDGVIFISIDDNEVHNLRKVCDEIFGDENFVNIISAKMKNIAGASGGGEDKKLKKNIEYILVYVKNYEKIEPFKPLFTKTELYSLVEYYKNNDISWKYTSILFEEGEKEYLGTTYDGSGDEIKIYKRINPIFKSISSCMKSENLSEKEVYYKYINKIFTTAMPQSSIRTRVVEYVEKLNINNELYSIEYVPKSGKNKDKMYEQFYKGEKFRLITWLRDVVEIDENQIFKKDLKGTYWDGFNLNNLSKEGNVKYANGKKPLALLTDILKMCTTSDDIVLDFFSGSATTGHATMQINAEDQGNRKFIMCQLAENLDDTFKKADKETKKQIKESIQLLDSIKKPHLLTELGKERLKRAGNQIIEDLEDNNLDIGFRVLKIDSSNMNDVYYSPDEITQDSLFDVTVDNIKPDRKPLDLLFQVLLDSGVDLTLPIVKKEILGKEVYFVDGNVLVACFENSIDEALVTEIAKMDDILKVVFKDSSFQSDDMRINVEQIFKQYSPDTQLKVI